MKLFSILIILFSLNVRAETCTYNVDRKSVKLKWTAYKTTKKVAVSGTFDAIDWYIRPGKTVSELMSHMKFNIKTDSVNSGNSLRDKRVLNSFFKLMDDGNKIKGHGISFDQKLNSSVIEVEMNKQRTPIVFKSSLDKELNFELNGMFDVLEHFKMTKSLKSISKLCYDLHKGADGVSKTWTDIAIKITGKLTKSCVK